MYKSERRARIMDFNFPVINLNLISFANMCSFAARKLTQSCNFRTKSPLFIVTMWKMSHNLSSDINHHYININFDSKMVKIHKIVLSLLFLDQCHLYSQESIPVGCVLPACTNCMCFNRHQMSAPWVGSSDEEVWTGFQSWESDVTSSRSEDTVH